MLPAIRHSSQEGAILRLASEERRFEVQNHSRRYRSGFLTPPRVPAAPQFSSLRQAGNRLQAAKPRQKELPPQSISAVFLGPPTTLRPEIVGNLPTVAKKDGRCPNAFET